MRYLRTLGVLLLGAVLGALTLSLVGLDGSFSAERTMRACFDDLGGLEAHAPIYLRGIEVGQVLSVGFDPGLRPCAELEIEARLELPVDSSAAIVTRNVMGERCITLEPGGAEELLGPGDEIAYTQGALALERLVGRLIHELASD